MTFLFSHFWIILIPTKERFIYYHASVYHNEAFFIFGGWNSNFISKIGRLDAVTRTWSLAGSLKQARSGHAVVFDGTQFLVAGGYGDFKTENCVPNGDYITCIEQELGLKYYADYPELMLLGENYGNDC